jgi:hypothetical protein
LLLVTNAESKLPTYKGKQMRKVNFLRDGYISVF